MVSTIVQELLAVVTDFRKAHDTRCPEIILVPESRKHEVKDNAVRPGESGFTPIGLDYGEDGFVFFYGETTRLVFYSRSRGEKETLMAFDAPKVEHKRQGRRKA